MDLSPMLTVADPFSDIYHIQILHFLSHPKEIQSLIFDLPRWPIESHNGIHGKDQASDRCRIPKIGRKI